MGVNMCDLGLGKVLDAIPKAQAETTKSWALLGYQ